MVLIVREDTVYYRQGLSFLVEGQLFGSDDLPYDYTYGDLDIYEVRGFVPEAIMITPDVPTEGTFMVEMDSDNASQLRLGRASWFKIRLTYPDFGSVLVMPPIWINSQ